MKRKLKSSLLFVAALLPIAVIGGFFTGVYSYMGYTAEMKLLISEQIGSPELFYIVTAIQTIGYTVFCGFLGYILSDKIGLLRTFKIEKDIFFKTTITSVVCGLLFSTDYWLFGKFYSEITYTYENITASNFIASVFYGGIIEEVILRLFLMSLFVLVIWKLFFKGKPKEQLSTKVYVIANILSAFVFAALHLPATFVTFENITMLIIFRCFLLNGGFGLVFGELYRKYGIQYAMIGHMGFHIVSKVIWMIFV